MDEMESVEAESNMNDCKRVTEYLTAMFCRKGPFHLYIGEGVDEMEFIEAVNYTNEFKHVAEYVTAMFRRMAFLHL